MSATVKKVLQAIIFLAVGLGILSLVYQRQNKQYQAECLLKGINAEDCSLMAKIWADIQSANYFWIAVIMLFFVLTNVIRAYRWRMMFEALGYKTRIFNLFGATMIGYLANLGIPRSGEVIKSGTLAGYEDIPLEKVLGTIFTDRIFDVIMLFIVLILTMIFGGSNFINYLNENIDLTTKLSIFTENKLFVAVVILGGLAGIYALWTQRNKIRSSALGQKIIDIVQGFGDGVQSVRKVSSVPLFLAQTVAIWVLYYLMMYIGFYSFAPTADLSMTAGLVAFAFGSLGVLIPSPGGMGSYHFLVGEALAMYGVSGSDAFSYANIVFFAIQIFISILLGLISLVVLPIVNNKK